MQNQNLKKSNSFIKTFFRQNLKENKRLLVILFLLQLLGIPAAIITASVNSIVLKQRISSNSSDIMLIIFGISFSIASALGIYTALKSFKYLHNKTQADKILSLPLSTKQRFTGSYLSGLIIYTVPYISAIVLSIILIFIFSRFSDFLFLTGRYEAEFIIYAVIGLFTMIMLYTATVFTCSCCGSILESIVYTVFLNAGIPLFIYVFGVIAYGNIPGLLPGYEVEDQLFLSGTFGGLYKLIDLEIYKDDAGIATGPVLYGIITWMIKYILVIAVLIGLSYYLYKKRKAEDISKPFVYSFIYFIFIITAVISIEGFCIHNKLHVIGFIISLIMYITLDLIKTRGFKNIKKHAVSFICFILSVGASFAIAKISAASDGFGKQNYIPYENKIKSVTISGCGGEQGIYNEYLFNFTVTDKESIDQIIKMHQATVAFYQEHSQNISRYMNDLYISYDNDQLHNLNDYNELVNTKSINLTYLNIYGNKIRRSFYVPNAQWYETMLVLAENDSMKNYMADCFDRFIQTQLSYSGNSGDPFLPVFSKFDKTKINKSIRCDDAQKLREIAECYRKDIMSVTKEDLLDLKTYCYIHTYYIPQCFENTIAVLNKYDVFAGEDDISPYSRSPQITICKSSAVKKTYLNSGAINTISANKSPEYFTVTSYDNHCLYALIKVAEPNYYTYDDCYLFNFQYKTYIIPPEYSSLAEEFISSSDYPANNR